MELPSISERLWKVEEDNGGGIVEAKLNCLGLACRHLSLTGCLGRRAARSRCLGRYPSSSPLHWTATTSASLPTVRQVIIWTAQPNLADLVGVVLGNHCKFSSARYLGEGGAKLKGPWHAGAGKTHTMEGTRQDPGINYRTMKELFRYKASW